MKNRKYQVNESFFNSWSRDMAYVLGFITADGTVSKYSLGIELKKSDESVLQFIKENLAPNSAIASSKKSYARLRINSIALVKSLVKFNVIQNKTKSIKIDFDIPDEFFADYLRGLFDGDGWATNRRNIVESGICSGSEGFLDYFHLRTRIGKVRKRTKKDKVYWVWEMNYSDSLKFREMIYDKGGFCLERKKSKFFFVRRPKSSKYWREEEVDFLKENHTGLRGNLHFLADSLKRSRKAISKKVWELGLA